MFCGNRSENVIDGIEVGILLNCGLESSEAVFLFATYMMNQVINRHCYHSSVIGNNCTCKLNADPCICVVRFFCQFNTYLLQQNFPFMIRISVLNKAYFDNLDFTEASLHVASVILT